MAAIPFDPADHSTYRRRDGIRVMLLVFAKCEPRTARVWREHVFVHAPTEGALIRKARAIWHGLQNVSLHELRTAA